MKNDFRQKEVIWKKRHNVRQIRKNLEYLKIQESLRSEILFM